MKKGNEKNDTNEGYDQLAQEIVQEYYSEGEIVDPLELARCFDIEVRAGNYEEHFRGLVRYVEHRFKIYLNLDILFKPDSEMGRFTCAHELGHTIIPSHRKELMKGNSLASTSGSTHFKSTNNSLKEIELQAQSFAASLLMPKDWFINYCLTNSLSLKSLYEDITTIFNTSFTSCVVRYIKLNLGKSVFIRVGKTLWQEQSNSFRGLYDGRIYFTYNPNRNRIAVQSNTLEIGGYKYEVSYVNISSWTTNIPAGSKADMLVKEEIIITGNYIYSLLTVES